MQTVADVSGRVAELGQVLADTEAATRTGDNDRADFGVARLLERGAERLVHRPVERVEDVRPVERDREDGAVAAGLDLGHGATLSQEEAGAELVGVLEHEAVAPREMRASLDFGDDGKTHGILQGGQYHDIYVKTPAGWRIKQRQYVPSKIERPVFENRTASTTPAR